MITPTLIGRLEWKAYLIFMATNLAFVPLVYFCYPETANLTLEEIDFLFIKPDESSVKISKRLFKERKQQGGRRDSIVVDTGMARRASATSTDIEAARAAVRPSQEEKRASSDDRKEQ